MRLIEWPTIQITATDIRLAIVFALAAAIFLDLAVMHRTKTAKVADVVGSTRPAANDMIDMRGLNGASWHCADVTISAPCSGAQSTPRCASIKCLIWHAFTAEDR
jgi:hypothetical protein